MWSGTGCNFCLVFLMAAFHGPQGGVGVPQIYYVCSMWSNHWSRLNNGWFNEYKHQFHLQKLALEEQLRHFEKRSICVCFFSFPGNRREFGDSPWRFCNQTRKKNYLLLTTSPPLSLPPSSPLVHSFFCQTDQLSRVDYSRFLSKNSRSWLEECNR